MRQSACFVINPIMVDNYAAFLIARRWVGCQTLWRSGLKAINFSWSVGPELLVCCLAYLVQLVFSFGPAFQ